MSNKNLSILFTGQGSQFPEMGVDLANKYSWVKERYQQSSDILGYDVLKKQEDPELLPLTCFQKLNYLQNIKLRIILKSDFLD